jgi:hypothetical protein
MASPGFLTCPRMYRVMGFSVITLTSTIGDSTTLASL